MIPASVWILVCTQPQDMRLSFDGLAREMPELPIERGLDGRFAERRVRRNCEFRHI